MAVFVSSWGRSAGKLAAVLGVMSLARSRAPLAKPPDSRLAIAGFRVATGCGLGAGATASAAGAAGFVVVAHVAPGTSHNMPKKLKGDLEGKPFEVDVVTEASEPFRPE